MGLQGSMKRHSNFIVNTIQLRHARYNDTFIFFNVTKAPEEVASTMLNTWVQRTSIFTCVAINIRFSLGEANQLNCTSALPVVETFTFVLEGSISLFIFSILMSWWFSVFLENSEIFLFETSLSLYFLHLRPVYRPRRQSRWRQVRSCSTQSYVFRDRSNV